MKKEMQKMADSPVVFKNEMLTQLNIVAPHIEKLLVEGNRDGSISVKYPKQTAQVISLLVSSWLSSFAFDVPYTEYSDKVLFLEQLGDVLGVTFYGRGNEVTLFGDWKARINLIENIYCLFGGSKI